MDVHTRNTLIQMAADDELTAEQVSLLERHLTSHPEDRAAIEGEQLLRAAVRRVLSEDVAVPEILRQRIESAWSSYAERTAPASLSLTDTPMRESAAPPARSRRLIFVPSGLAAGILILIGASLVIGLWPEFTGKGRTEAARTVWELTQESMRKTSFLDVDPEADQSELPSLLERAGIDELPDLTSKGFVYKGFISESDVPNSRAILFVQESDLTQRAILWIVPDTSSHASDLLEYMKPGVAYRLMGPSAESLPNRCYAWRSGRFVFYFCLGSEPQSQAPVSDEELSIDLARLIGMPDGEPVRLP